MMAMPLETMTTPAMARRIWSMLEMIPKSLRISSAGWATVMPGSERRRLKTCCITALRLRAGAGGHADIDAGDEAVASFRSAAVAVCSWSWS